MDLQNWIFLTSSIHQPKKILSINFFQLEELKAKEREISSMRKQIIENESQVSSFIKHKTHTLMDLMEQERPSPSYFIHALKISHSIHIAPHSQFIITKGHSLFMCSSKKICLKKFERALFFSFLHTSHSCTAKRVSERPVSVSCTRKKTFEQVVVDRFSRAFEVDWERCKRRRHIRNFSYFLPGNITQSERTDHFYWVAWSENSPDVNSSPRWNVVS